MLCGYGVEKVINVAILPFFNGPSVMCLCVGMKNIQIKMLPKLAKKTKLGYFTARLVRKTIKTI